MSTNNLKENGPFCDYMKLIKKSDRRPNGPLWLNKKKSFMMSNADEISPVLNYEMISMSGLRITRNVKSTSDLMEPKYY